MEDAPDPNRMKGVETVKKIAVIMGSDSDLPIARKALDTLAAYYSTYFLRFKVSSGSSQFFVTSLAGGGGIITDRSAGKGKRQVAAAHEFFEVFFTEKAR